MHESGLLLNRTRKAITNRASDMGVTTIAEPDWAVPHHLYSDEDRAFRAWGGPVGPRPGENLKHNELFAASLGRNRKYSEVFPESRERQRSKEWA